MAKVIPTAGEHYEVQPKNGKFFELEELQKIVGGYIEIIYLKKGLLMVINEDGKFIFHDKPNHDASFWAIKDKAIPFYDAIFGPALVCKNEEIR